MADDKPPARPLPMRPTGSGDSGGARQHPGRIGQDVDLQVGSEAPAVLPRWENPRP